ncbi:hypothetical protein BDZ85DRAFT_278966 [Elsinoe ampelina]|uniref:Uncharacterized protein n=1 Tax=Elsinoe ampelina TaxID=302913 RepID=A0A6A6GMR3_9PEZI|nr:hypothetical protein BDZ85DRAFT_278966 [Elsinoe ampelina]
MSPEPRSRRSQAEYPGCEGGDPNLEQLLSTLGVDEGRRRQLCMTHNRRVVKIQEDRHFYYGLYQHLTRHPRVQLEQGISRFLMDKEEENRRMETAFEQRISKVLALSAVSHKGNGMSGFDTQCRLLWAMSEVLHSLLKVESEKKQSAWRSRIERELAKHEAKAAAEKHVGVRRSARIRARKIANKR